MKQFIIVFFFLLNFIGGVLGQDADAAKVERGSRTAKGGFQNEDEIRNKFNAWKSDSVAQAWLQAMNYQIADIVSDFDTLDPTRLEQEAAIIMTKADIREELDRFAAHIASVREMMAEGGAIGRRLDFLCQELNREANTICSKAHDTSVTRIGLDMKATVEQFREQVQNIE